MKSYSETEVTKLMEDIFVKGLMIGATQAKGLNKDVIPKKYASDYIAQKLNPKKTLEC